MFPLVTGSFHTRTWRTERIHDRTRLPSRPIGCDTIPAHRFRPSTRRRSKEPHDEGRFNSCSPMESCSAAVVGGQLIKHWRKFAALLTLTCIKVWAPRRQPDEIGLDRFGLTAGRGYAPVLNDQ